MGDNEVKVEINAEVKITFVYVFLCLSDSNELFITNLKAEKSERSEMQRI